MKALKYSQAWQVNIHEIPPLHCLEADDVIVNIAVCGVCGTDIGIINDHYPVQ